MDNKFIENVKTVLLMLISIGYLVAIFSIGTTSLKSPNQVLDANGQPTEAEAKPPVIRADLLAAVTGLGTVLAILTGKQLGIPTEEEGDEAGAEVSLFARLINSVIWKRLLAILTSIWKGFHPDNIPKIATVLYLAGLILAGYFYVRESFSPASVELLRTSWSSLIGIVLAIFTMKE